MAPIETPQPFPVLASLVSDEPAFLRMAWQPAGAKDADVAALGLVECVQWLADGIHHFPIVPHAGDGKRPRVSTASTAVEAVLSSEFPKRLKLPGAITQGAAGKVEVSSCCKPKGQHSGALRSEKHLPIDDGTTTVKLDMCKASTRTDLLRLLDASGLKSLYDFVYLPTNYKTRCNYGYAVVNFVSPAALQRARDTLEGHVWADDVAVTFSAFYCQGQKALMDKYRRSAIMSEADNEFKPLVLRAGKMCVLRMDEPVRKSRRQGTRQQCNRSAVLHSKEDGVSSSLKLGQRRHS